MKRFLYFFLPLVLLTGFAASAQEDQQANDDETIYEDENAYVNYREQDPFRILDTPRGQLGVFGLNMPFIEQQAFGGGLDLEAWYTNNLAVGLSVAIAGRRVAPTFNYSIGSPRLLFMDISLLNEYKLVQWRGFEASARLYTGYSLFDLSDKSVKVKYTWYDEYGNEYEGEKPLPVAKNHFLRVAPAFALRYHLSKEVMIEGSAVYNFFIGNAAFGTRGDFNNYMLQLGFKFEL